MIGAALKWLTGGGWRLAVPVALVIALLIAWHQVGATKRATVEAKAEARQARADTRAAVSAREADAALVQRQTTAKAAEVAARQEFEDATAHLPPAGLDDRDRIDLCGELRDVGYTEADLPECIGVRRGASPGP